MKAYCINLERRPDRLAHMQAMCDLLAFPFERFPAIDGTDPATIEALRASLGREARASEATRQVSLAAYATYQSHRAIWELLEASNEPAAMVLEDDLLLAEGIGFYLATDWIPSDAGLVKLETNGTRQQIGRRGQIPAGPRLLARIASYHSGAGAYVITRGAARVLLNLPNQMSTPVDEILFERPHLSEQRLLTYQMVPAPAIQAAALNGDQAASSPWARTSISQHWESVDHTDQAETRSRRVLRRARGEVESLWRGTHYTTVSFG